MANFTWLVSQLDSIPTVDGMNKVISTIHYRAQKTHTETIFDAETETSSEKDLFTADTYGAISMPAPHEASFTPYDEVTKEMVEGWLTDALDTEAIEANLDAQIQNFLNPPIVAYKLPWISVPAIGVVVEETTVEPAEEETTTEEATEEPATEETPTEEPAVEEEIIPE
jgi:hypothetical protein